MPRFPRIYADATVPARLPSQDVPLTAPGQGAEIAAGQSLERTGLAVTDQGLAIERQLRKGDAALEADQAVTQLKTQFADQQEQLRASGIHPDAYAGAVATSLDKLGQGLTATMRYPEAQAAFQQHLEQFKAAEGVKAVHTGWEMKYNQIKFGEDIQQRQNENDYVANPTQDNLAKIFEVPQRGLQAGYRSEAESRAMFAGSMTRIQNGLIDKEYQAPQFQQQVVDKLRIGAYPWLSREEQFKKADTLEAKQRADQAAQRVALEQSRKDIVDGYGKSISDKIEAKDYASARALLQQSRDAYSVTEYNTERDRINNQEAAGGKNNPLVDQPLAIRVYGDTSLSPGVARATLTDAKAALVSGDINQLTYDKYAAHLQGRITAFSNQADTRNDQAMLRNDAKRHYDLAHWAGILREAIPVDDGNGLLAKMVPEARNALRQGLMDMTDAASRGENVAQWYKTNSANYTVHAHAMAQTALKQVFQDLRFKTPQDLMAHEAAFPSPTAFKQEMQKMEDYIRLKQAIDVRNPATKTPEPTAGQPAPATVKPGYNLGMPQ